MGQLQIHSIVGCEMSTQFISHLIVTGALHARNADNIPRFHFTGARRNFPPHGAVAYGQSDDGQKKRRFSHGVGPLRYHQNSKTLCHLLGVAIV